MAMDKQTAQRYIDQFSAKFGEPHRDLARHLAFPTVLTPDMAYQIWAHFQRDTAGTLLNMPWIGVADVLLSSLCSEIGNELYRIDDAIRSQLLTELGQDPRFGKGDKKHNRLEELAHFLQSYVQKRFSNLDKQERVIAERQQMQSLSVLAPERALQNMVQRLNRAQIGRGEIRRLTAQVSSLRDTAVLQLPQTDDDQLSDSWNQLESYAQARRQLTERKVDFRRVAGELDARQEVAGVRLPGTAELIDPEKLVVRAEPMRQKKGERPWQQQQVAQKIDLGQFEDFESPVQQEETKRPWEQTAQKADPKIDLGQLITPDQQQEDSVSDSGDLPVTHITVNPEYHVFDTLNTYLSFDEFKTLCFDWGIDDERLGGRTKSEKIRSLLFDIREDSLRQNKLVESFKNIYRNSHIDLSFSNNQLSIPDNIDQSSPLLKSAEYFDTLLRDSFSRDDIEILCLALGFSGDTSYYESKDQLSDSLLNFAQEHDNLFELAVVMAHGFPTLNVGSAPNQVNQPEQAIDEQKLLRTLEQQFSLNEFRNICFGLEVDFDALSGNSKSAKMRSLVIQLRRQEKLLELIQYLESTYPEGDWGKFMGQQSGRDEPAEDTLPTINRVTLYRVLSNHFNLEEIKTVCFDLDIDFDNLAGTIKSTKIRELILHCERQSQLDELLALLRDERPNIDVEEILAPPEPFIEPEIDNNVDLTRVSEILNDQFNFEELEELCFLLNIDAEQLRRRTLSVFVVDLLDEVERSGRVGELVQTMLTERPNIDRQAIETEPQSKLNKEDQSDTMNFGALLRAYRKRAYDPDSGRYLTQRRLAELITVQSDNKYLYSAPLISRWEHGTRRLPNRKILIWLLTIFWAYEGMNSLTEANRLAKAGDFGNLTKEEIQQINPNWLNLTF